MNPIVLTPSAKDSISRLRAEHDIAPELNLRVGVKGGGGCGGGGGFQYVLGFDKLKEGDIEYLIDDIVVYIDKAESLYLLGMEIDWQAVKGQEGFVFNNPLAKETEGYDFSI